MAEHKQLLLLLILLLPALLLSLNTRGACGADMYLPKVHPTTETVMPVTTTTTAPPSTTTTATSVTTATAPCEKTAMEQATVQKDASNSTGVYSVTAAQSPTICLPQTSIQPNVTSIRPSVTRNITRSKKISDVDSEGLYISKYWIVLLAAVGFGFAFVGCVMLVMWRSYGLICCESKMKYHIPPELSARHRQMVDARIRAADSFFISTLEQTT